nr:alanine racemase [Achromobacter sp.]
MSDDRLASSSRRRLLAAAAGATLATAVDAQAAPLLGGRKPSRVLASNAWIEVDPAVFDHNLGLIRSMLTGGAQVCAVMKADAYGIGIDMVMPNVIRARIPYVGIASTEEARMARACGFKGRLMRVRAATAWEIEAALPYAVEELVGEPDAAQAVARIFRRRRGGAPVH